MKKCPACGKWTMDFDDYFGRFRCYDAECGWIPPSSAEREIRLLRSQKQPLRLASVRLDEIGLTLDSFYDVENDALVFDFGASEPTFDLPEPDGVMIWKIERDSDRVAGFCILGASKFGKVEIRVDIDEQKERIERILHSDPDAVAGGRVSKGLVDKIAVTAEPRVQRRVSKRSCIDNASRKAVVAFENLERV